MLSPNPPKFLEFLENMARNENPPFGRGETWFNGVGATTTDPTAVVGKEWLFEDTNPVTKVVRSNKSVWCRAVRNVSGISLLPRRLVTYKNAVNSWGLEVDGYTTTTAAGPAHPVDEFLPSTGVANNDVFWIVIRGPAECITDLAQVDDISVGSRVVALTAATSQATTAGRLDLADFNASTTTQSNQILNYIGFALSAVTSGNTNNAFLVEVGHW